MWRQFWRKVQRITAKILTEPSLRRWLFACVIAVGILAGVGGYTFFYAEGPSYLSDNPKSCANCHIMNSQYDSWQKSGHHAAAVCVDCHLPTSFIPMYAAKAMNGYHHSKGFTLQDFAEPIQIKPINSQILQNNCLRCHGPMVDTMLPGATTDRDAIRCVHCHRSVGHGPPAGLGRTDQGLAKEMPRGVVLPKSFRQKEPK